MAKEIVTQMGLTNKLFEELGWRRKELKLIKDQIPVKASPLQSALLRSALPLLYAHWEGFIKISMSCYLEHVSRKYLLNNQLTIKFLALSVQHKLGELVENNFENRVKIIDILFANYNSRSNVPKKNIINTKSNLRFDVLKEILFILDLDDSHVDKYRDLINDLVDNRNHIAHGEYNVIDYPTFINFYDDTIELMEYLKTQIENNAVLKTYELSSPLI